MKLRTIHLDGRLAEYCGVDSVKLAGDTLHVLARGLISRFGNKVKEILATSEWQVYFDSIDEDGSVGYSRVEDKLNKVTDVHILAPIAGAGRVGQVIMGIVIIIVGIISIWASWGTDTPAAYAAIAGGFAMILGGAMTIYTALNTPKAQAARSAPDERASFTFNGATNVIEQGGAVPLAYGRSLLGSTVVSAGIDVEQLQSYSSPLGSDGAPNSAFGIHDV